ncbi:oligosaccharide flippase family protein [soil metagenome]
MDGSRRLLRNSIANLARGASAGLVAVILPAVLVRALPSNVYSAWALVLQIAAYIAMLDLGLQVGIGRFIARENARGDDERRNHFFAGGALLLAVCGMAALVATGLLAWALPVLFPKLTPNLVPECRLAVLLIGGSAAISLPGSAIAAMFVGLERYGIPALVLGAGRLIQIGLTSWVAVATHDLVQVSIAYASSNVLMQVAYLVLLRRSLPSLRVGRNNFRRDVIGELAHYCANLSVWNLSMFLVYGLDTAIVAEIDFRTVAPYSICTNLMAVFVGFMGSSFNVLISRTSALDGQGEHRAVGQLLVLASSICTRMLLAIGMIAALWATPLFRAWIGPEIGAAAMPFFWILMVANGLRLLFVPYATVLMGTGEHKWGMIANLSEGITNLIASVLLGRAFGPIGVAYGTLVGAAVGVVVAILVTFPRAVRIECSRNEYLMDGLVRPSAAFLPLTLAVCWHLRQQTTLSFGGLAVGLVLSVLWLTHAHPLWGRFMKKMGISRV